MKTIKLSFNQSKQVMWNNKKKLGFQEMVKYIIYKRKMKPKLKQQAG